MAGGQYTPKSGKLHVFTSLDVTVNFGGDNQGTFGDGDGDELALGGLLRAQLRAQPS